MKSITASATVAPDASSAHGAPISRSCSRCRARERDADFLERHAAAPEEEHQRLHDRQHGQRLDGLTAAPHEEGEQRPGDERDDRRQRERVVEDGRCRAASAAGRPPVGRAQRESTPHAARHPAAGRRLHHDARRRARRRRCSRRAAGCSQRERRPRWPTSTPAAARSRTPRGASCRGARACPGRSAGTRWPPATASRIAVATCTRPRHLRRQSHQACRVTNLNTGGTIPITIDGGHRRVQRVGEPAQREERLADRARASSTAVSSIMIGDSTSHASENATPYAARLNAASGMRAMIAATYGPSADIISHVAARGSQKTRIVRMLNTRRRSYRTRIPRVLPAGRAEVDGGSLRSWSWSVSAHSSEIPARSRHDGYHHDHIQVATIPATASARKSCPRASACWRPPAADSASSSSGTSSPGAASTTSRPAG